ncbi:MULTISPECIES: sensor domain-containing diguanylate cyclase [Vibrio]|uniref:sensor domain-containing diguanylate cyclase n=1 Tax=Vibrio TaxID=662 RepID=UPI000312AFAC|nr:MULTISPECIES: diguanylate cyclase [Vibrio]MCM5509089.1 diguanylate cyclase [Vibrio sp. SCSIO 43169]MDE3898209.1 diguanylate cyclase [Vibrio sp. CC007]QFT37591.1 putative diguanylate cyclase AdrA [Vibrio sp. THAF64]QGM35493.1 putative diguanylate cyclase AdrA [Vibrio sp. THAF191d]QGN70994.1 putative diguanylate cyclase AdrA [Vibrio sp. THAF191c]
MRQRKNIFWHLCITTVVLVSIAFAYYAQQYQNLEEETVELTAKQAMHQLAYSEREYQSVRSQLVSIIELLSHSRSLYDYILSPSAKNREVVEEVWSSMAINQKWYSQIRFIDNAGKEQLRLNYLLSGNRVQVAEQLQDKSHRGYFRYAKLLQDEQIGAWGIDLEMENGELVFPYKPALRLITPVEVQGQRAGYLILNIDIWYLTSRLNYSPDKSFRPELVGETGFYMISDDPSKLFGHLLASRSQHNLARYYPETWQMMQDQKSGYHLEKDHLIVFNQIYMEGRQKLYLVIDLSQEELKVRSERDYQILLKEASIVLLMVLAFTVPATSGVVYYRKRSLESQLARAALSGMSAVVISDKKHHAVLVNDEFERLTGYRQKDIASQNMIKALVGEEQFATTLQLFEALSSNQIWEGEITIHNQKTHTKVTAIMRVQCVLAKGRKVSYYITSLVDISERKELEERLRILSEKDELTQLWNRRKFELELRHSAKLSGRYPERHDTCLALLDIDFFKRVNDELGHDEGDRVISRVGAIIIEALRETDFIARIGGEEFAIIMPHTSIEEAEQALNRVRIAVEMAADVPITVSVGLTDLTSNSTRCYKCADIALYESKTLGRNRVSVCRSCDEIA